LFAAGGLMIPARSFAPAQVECQGAMWCSIVENNVAEAMRRSPFAAHLMNELFSWKSGMQHLVDPWREDEQRAPARFPRRSRARGGRADC